MKYSFLALVVAAIFFFGFGVNSPGVVFEIETTYHSHTPGVESAEMSVEGDMLKMEILPDRGDGNKVKDEVIFRGDRKEMIVVDHNRKTYMVMDKATVEKIAGQLGGIRSEMDEMMKNLPDDVKKQIEEAQKNGVNIPGMTDMPTAQSIVRSFKKTGHRETVNGYPCVKWEVFDQNNVKIQEILITDWPNITGGEEAMNAFIAMSEFFAELKDGIPAMGPGGNAPFDGFDTMLEEMKELDGFPVVTRDFLNGELESESVLESARHRTLDPADFEPPAGYKRQQMF